jgi:outer membrane protein assembly factor BamB
MPRCPLPAVLLLLLAAGPLPAQPSGRVSLPGESGGTGRRLDAADKLAADKQYAAAAEEYVRILDEAGDDLVAVDAHLAVPARRLCHLRLAALPVESLRPYRTRVDPQAKKWLEQGSADHDLNLLRRVVDETFCGRRTDGALDLLGDLEFERGHFCEAGRWWRMLARPASEAARAKPRPPWDRGDEPPHLDLLFPDPQLDVARVRAKQVLALLFRGDPDARAELDAFRALHPKTEGHLAGRKGNYADTLQAIAARPVSAEPTEDAWPTFGGDPARGAVLPAERSDPNRLNPLIKNGPAWQFRLGTLRPPAAQPLSVAERARHLAFHPIIVGRQVLVADARRVSAFDATTGDEQSWDLARDGERRVNEAEGLKVDSALPAPADLRYTLTAADGRVYARLGAQGFAPPAKAGADDSYLVCLRFADPGRRLAAVWLREADAPGGKGPRAVFEGAPVVRDGLLYVATSRFEGGAQMITEVRCYSADTGAGPRWKQDVLTTRDVPAPPAPPRYRHQLLTLAGRHVVYATHAGAVVALDARTGRREWAYRHPSAPLRTPGGNPVPRDLAPAVYAAGRLYVALADYDRLLCLDPETGQLVWERERIAVVHLLGVGGGRLIFTTPTGLRAVRAADGDDVWQTTDISGSDGLPSYGRGFLAGQYVFWPTTSGVKVLNQDDGQVPIDYIPGPSEVRGHLDPGNLAYAGGILAVADSTGLRVYSRTAPEKKDEAPERPGQALGALSRRAMALAEAGRPADALADWQRILSDDTLRRGTLRDANRLPQSAAVVAGEQIDRLLKDHGRTLYAATEEKARAALASGNGDAAALEKVADEYPNAVATGEALRQLAGLHEEAGRWGAAAQAYRRLLRRQPAEGEREKVALALRRVLQRGQEKPPSPDPPEPALPLTRAWEKGERLLASADGPPAADVFLVRGTTLLCREAATGAERWHRPIAGAPTWAGRHADIALVAGPDGVRGFALSDGTPLWELPTPDAAAFTDPRLSAFQTAGGRLFCLQGECRLLALDIQSGRVLWQSWSPAARLGADVPGVRFSPHYLATEDRVLIQSAGRCRLLDARTGAVVRDLPTELILWAQPPLPLGENRVGVVNARQQVAALDLSSGKVTWSHALSAWSTLSGEPALLVGGSDGLFVAVPRNYGYALQRLDPQTGRALWEDEAQLGPDRVDYGCFALDRNGVYYSSRNVVTALSLDDGRTLWEQALPGPAGSWRLRRMGAALLAWPAEAWRTKFHSRWLVSSLELAVTFPPEDRAGRGIPVLLLDPRPDAPQDERVLERLNLVPPLPGARGRLAPDEELTAVPTLLRERAAADGPLLRLTRAGLVVGWDGKAWALRTDR